MLNPQVPEGTQTGEPALTPAAPSEGASAAAPRGRTAPIATTTSMAVNPSAPRSLRPGSDREIPPDAPEILVRIDSDRAITTAREHARRLSAHAGFGAVDRALLATAVSELGRNILLYAGRGEMLVALVDDGRRIGVAITACDDGPGILDLDDAVRDGYSTSGRPGLGLPGIKRVCDEFHVSSSPDQGTTVSIKKWRDRQ